ncbi:MAG: exopolysaccharide biosynthesis protein [Pseudanabaena sp. RU_4_16]|nr:exopolysaccharide biosynthesis protein [Pseudanabaena sp. RU_4_16]
MQLSETIQSLLEEYADRSLSIATVLERTGHQGFGIISGLFTLPLLVPLPVPLPGLSALFGAGTILMGLQMALGLHRPHLPPPIARLELSPAMSQILLKNLNRILRPVERLARPRLLSVSRSWPLRRLVGLCLFWNALLMSLPLPIPFTNLLPAYTILVLAIGLLEMDGFLLLMGYGMTLATTFFFVSIAGIIWAIFLSLGNLSLSR